MSQLKLIKVATQHAVKEHAYLLGESVAFNAMVALNRLQRKQPVSLLE